MSPCCTSPSRPTKYLKYQIYTNIFTYLCFENLILNIDFLCYYVNLILSHTIYLIFIDCIHYTINRILNLYNDYLPIEFQNCHMITYLQYDLPTFRDASHLKIDHITIYHCESVRGKRPGCGRGCSVPGSGDSGQGGPRFIRGQRGPGLQSAASPRPQRRQLTR